MVKVTLEVETDTAAFADRAEELGRIFRNGLEKIGRDGFAEGDHRLYDVNGNAVGRIVLVWDKRPVREH